MQLPPNMLIRGNTYYVRLMINGRDKWVSTRVRVPSLKTAMRRADEIKVGLRDETFGWQSKDRTLNEWWAEFKQTLPPNRIDQIQRTMNHVLPVLGSMRLSRLTPSAIARYIQRRQIKVAESTTYLERANLSIVLAGAVTDGILQTNPVSSVDVPKMAARTRILSLEEQAELLPRLNPHIRRWVIFMLGTGLRLNESLALVPSDVAMSGIRVVGKGAKTRMVPITGAVRKILDEQLKDGHLWHFKSNYYQRQLAKGAEDTGIDHLWPHALRHTFATRCAVAGMPPAALKEIMGHSSITITMKYYIHLGDKDLANALNDIDIGL